MRTDVSGKQTGNHKSYLPCEKMVAQFPGVSIHLNGNWHLSVYSLFVCIIAKVVCSYFTSS